MRVSVVIPCHNSLRYLPETVDSVLAQTLAVGDGDGLEVVLVDDGGTDDLAGWVAQRGDGRIRLIRQDNAGVSAARNRGVAEATGELIAFIDSDDTWEPTFLAETVGRFDAEPDLGLAYSWYDVIDAEGRRNGRVIVSDWEGDVWEQFLTRNPVACSGAVVPKKVFESVGGFSVNRDRFPVDVEDWELWIRIAADHRVAVVSEPLVHHRRHDSNSTSNVESLDAAYRNMLEVVFDGVDGARLDLRPMATARAEILLGWHSLIDRRDGPRALAYRRSAARHHPPVARSMEYWRLGAAAWALSTFGEGVFTLARSLNRVVRRVLVAIPIGRILRREGSFTP
ncbi:MAG: glycosyltransferase family 2 protein [Acidimicrobiales bacterium]